MLNCCRTLIHIWPPPCTSSPNYLDMDDHLLIILGNPTSLNIFRMPIVYQVMCYSTIFYTIILIKASNVRIIDQKNYLYNEKPYVPNSGLGVNQSMIAIIGSNARMFWAMDMIYYKFYRKTLLIKLLHILKVISSAYLE